MYEITNTDYQPMQELIKITEQNGKRAVSARELHKFLEVQTPFTMWIDRMFEYGFAEKLGYQNVAEAIGKMGKEQFNKLYEKQGN